MRSQRRIVLSQSVAARISAIQSMSGPELKAEWCRLFETDPPAYNRRYLEHRLIHRAQELLLGGLSPRTVARLEALAAKQSPDRTGKRRRAVGPISGTRLIRERQGVEVTVTVLADGFEYQGRPFKSLSAIARQITGTRWNGPLFFGLRRPGRAS